MRSWTGRLFFACLVAVFVLSAPLGAQQRPLRTEDPRLIPEGRLVTETGFGYFDQTPFPIQGIEGDLLSLIDGGFHIGLGSRAEFQITGVLRNYLWVRDGGEGRRNDWGDGLISTKIAIVKESGRLPDISFRPTVLLPNASNESLGKDGTDFFASLLVGKSVGNAYVFGNFGIGILDDAVRAAAQQDVIVYGLAALVPFHNRFRLAFEINGLENPQSNPTPGGEDRSQTRFGIQLDALGMRWDVAATAGLTDVEHRAGVVFGFTKEFTLWR